MHSQKGQALTGVIIFISLLCWFTLEKISIISMEKEKLNTFKTAFKADDLCESGVNIARAVLKKSADLKMSTNSLWRTPLSVLPVNMEPGTYINVNVIDDESRLNIRTCTIQELKGLLENIEKENPFSDDTVSVANAADHIMYNRDDLRSISDLLKTDYGKKIFSGFKGISKEITLFGTNTININTASKNVISALLKNINTKQTDTFTDIILAKRPFSSVEDAIKYFPKHYSKDNRLNFLKRFSVKSSFFSIYSTARVMNTRKSIENIIKLNKENNTYSIQEIYFKKNALTVKGSTFLLGNS